MHIDFSLIRSLAFGGLSFLYMVLIFVLVIFDVPALLFFGALLFLMSAWSCFYLVYFCEDYIVYTLCACSVIVVSFMLLACSVPVISILQEGAGEQLFRKMLVIFPIIAIFLSLLCVLSSKPRSTPSIASRNRVVSLAPVRTVGETRASWVFIGSVSVSVGAFAVRHIGGMFAEAFMVSLLTMGVVMIIFTCRESLRGLYYLAKKGRQMKIKFTFYWIDEIRAARRRSYIVRFVGWFR